MKTILCYLYESMADFEITLLLHRLKNTGACRILSISETLAPVLAQSGLRYVPDLRIQDMESRLEEVDALIIPGGPINNTQNSICPMAIRMIEEGKLVGAICFAPQFLGRAGILDSYRFTTSCSPEKIRSLQCQNPFPWSNYVEARVVRDRNLITAKGYAFVDFSLEVCDALDIFSNPIQRYEQMVRIIESSPCFQAVSSSPTVQSL